MSNMLNRSHKDEPLVLRTRSLKLKICSLGSASLSFSHDLEGKMLTGMWLLPGVYSLLLTM